MVTPVGLITTPNEMGQYPVGALSTADNVRMSRPGLLTSIASPTSLLSLTSASSTTILHRFLPIDSAKVVAFSNDTAPRACSIVDTVGFTDTACPMPASYAFTVAQYTPQHWTFPSRVRNRVAVNGTLGMLVMDSTNPTSSTLRTFREGGIAQPGFLVSTVSHPGTGDGAIPGGVCAAYQIVVVREIGDYIIKSVPSSRIIITNIGTTLGKPNFFVTGLFPSSGFAAGDYIEMYRTDGLAQATVDSDPGTTLKLVKRYQLTSTDISNTFVGISDSATMVAPYYKTAGRELYTNPYQETALGANRLPDVAACSAVFREFMFQGNITERPQITLSVPGGWYQNGFDPANYTAAVRANGIGSRPITSGATTAASNILTGIAASDLVGVVIGQSISSSNINSGISTTITAVGASTITMVANATTSAAIAAGATAVTVADIIQVGGIDRVLLSGLASVFAIQAETTSASGGIFIDGALAGLAFPDQFNRSFTLESLRYSLGASLSVRGTNGANYSPPIPEYTASPQVITANNTKNLLKWSKDSEPEHWPAVNETRVGSEQIVSLVPTKDALFIFCTDGVYRLSGAAGVWSVDTVDPKCFIAGAKAACVLNEQVFAYTNKGFVAVTDAGITDISRGRIEDLLPGASFTNSAYSLECVADIAKSEVWITLTATISNVTPQVSFIYNVKNDAFTRLSATQYTGLSTMAYQDFTGTTAPGAMVYGLQSPGAGPRVCYETAGPYLTATVIYQPLFDGDPASIKQWIDFTAMVSANGADTPVFGMIADTSALFTAQAKLVTPVDCNANFGVPRRNAIAPTIKPGVRWAGLFFDLALRGVTLRYTPMTPQQSRK